jgi:hypothetical protein
MSLRIDLLIVLGVLRLLVPGRERSDVAGMLFCRWLPPLVVSE